ncbi:hypothetical protein DP134_12080 [Clostridium tetani]|nr:hypothetical protein DP134_12080 [Clostridium tetani]
MYNPYFKYWSSLRIAVLLLTVVILYNTILTMKKKNIYNLISSLFIVISYIFLNFYFHVLYDEMNFKSDNFIIFVSFIGGILYIYNIFIYLKKD